MARIELIEQFIQHMGSVFRGTKHNLELPSGIPEMSQTEIGILFRIAACGSTEAAISPGDLAEVMRMTNSAATQFLDKLEEKGMITRRRDRTDRRAVQVVLSDQAKKSIAQIRKLYAKRLEPFFTNLTDAELVALVKLAMKIKADSSSS